MKHSYKLMLILSLLFLVGCTQVEDFSSKTGTNSPSNTEPQPSTVKIAFHLGAPVVTGTREALSITGDVYFASVDLGKQGSLFIAAALSNGDMYFLNSGNQWIKYDGVTVPEAFGSGKAPEKATLKIAENADVKDAIFNEAVIYVGYGLANTANDAFKEMSDQKRYLSLYTIK